MKAPEQITTQRLLLRRPLLSDAEAVFSRYASDQQVTHYLAWPCHESIEQSLGFMHFSESEWTAWPAGPYILELRHTGQLLGATGLRFESAHQAETGYVLARDAWGKGYATEALLALMKMCEGLDLNLVIANCHHEHSASQNVLKKCGFACEANSTTLQDFPNLRPTQQPAFTFARRFEPVS